ncbi:MAG: replication-associated recombination protein A [Proteobacteria bacterium]|nr:replication-associated recombination protein A [Pseudomonadota bacterium]
MNTTPLADRLRPVSFDEFVGQEHLTAQGRLFRKSVEEGNLSSCIFWGPPGCGKTSLANVVANVTKKPFAAFSAVLQGVKDVRDIVEDAKKNIGLFQKNTILFIDEIHRFNKAQQDALLPHVEHGTIILIGATTENPSFEIISALLSRCQVYVLYPLKDEHIAQIINRALTDDVKGLGRLRPELDKDAFDFLVNISNGDIRTALNALELATNGVKPDNIGIRHIALDYIKEAVSSRKIAYDKRGEEYYNLISALHKSLRGSDVQAALYWLARMIEGGADPLYIARRLMRFASEDIGMADPNAVLQAMAAKDAVDFIGYPECSTALAQCVVYLATAPKSNHIYTAFGEAQGAVQNTRNEPMPLNIRNAPTKLMKELDYGKDYQYDHNTEHAFSGQDFLPESLQDVTFYKPGPYGFEKEIKKRMDFWANLKKKIKTEKVES